MSHTDWDLVSRLLKPELVEAWVEGQPDYKVVGVCGDVEMCLVAEYAREVIGLTEPIYDTTDLDSCEGSISTPHVLGELARQFDYRFLHAKHAEVTAGQVKAWLRRRREEGRS